MQIIPAVIAIVVVFVMLVVFRAMDKNNRSLDKVRRYADKVTENIDKFVDEKTQILKNAALELDVHQKAEKQLLSRVAEIEDRLNSRAGEVEALFDRVAEYDRAVTDLVEMTKKVDANLQLLKAEESFLDGLSKRIHSSNAKMDGIEKDLPKILSDFSGKNNEQINRLWTSATKEAEKTSQRLHSDIEQSRFAVGEFSDYMQQLESKRDGVEQEMLDSGKLRLDHLLESSLSEFENFSGELKTELVQSKEAHRGALTDFQEEAIRVKDDYRATLNKSADVLKKHIVAGDKVISSIKLTTEGLQEKAVYVEEIISRINGYDTEIKAISRLSNEVSENLNELQKGAGFVSATAKRLKLSQSAISQLEQKIPEIEKNFLHSNREALDKLSLEVKSGIENTATSFMSDFEVIKESVNDFSALMHSLDEKSETMVNDTGVRLESLVKELSDRSEESSRQLSENFKSELTHYSSSLTSELQDKFQRVRTEFSEMEGSFRTLESSISENATQALSDIEERSAASVMSLNQESEAISGSARQVFSQIKERIEQLQSESVKSVNDSSASLISHQADVDKLLYRVKGIVSNMDERSDQVEQLSSRLNDYDIEMEKLSDLTREAREGLSWLESKSRFIQKLETKIKKSENSLTGLENSLPKLQSRFTEENDMQLALAVKQVMASTDKMAGSIKQELETVSTQVDDFSVYIGLLQNRRDQIGQSMLNDIQNKLSVMSDEAVLMVSTSVKGTADQLKASEQQSLDILHSRSDEMRSQLENSISQLSSSMTIDLDEVKNRLETTASQVSSDLSTQFDQVTNGMSKAVIEAEDHLSSELNKTTKILDGKVTNLTDTVTRQLNSTQVTTGELLNEINSTAKEKEIVFNRQKASGEAILEKLLTLTGQLSSRGEEIDSMVSRLNQYDSQMEKLSQMSRDADLSLSDLQKKSRFVQGLSKTISRGEDRMKGLEKRVPAIEENFKIENQKQLEGIYEQLSQTGAEKLQLLNGDILKAAREVEGFSAELEGFEQRNRVMAEQSLETLQSSVNQLMDNTQGRQDELIRIYKAELEQMEESFNQGTDSVTVRFRALADQVESRMANCDTEWQNKLVDFQRHAGEIENSYQKNIESVVERAKDLDDEVFSALRLEIEERARMTEKEMATGISNVRSRLDDSNNELISLFGEMRSEISVQKEGAEKMIQDLQMRVNGSLETVEKQVQGRIVLLTTNTDSAHQDIEKNVEAYAVKSLSLLESAKVSSNKEMDRIRSEVSIAVGTLSEKMERVSGDSMKDYQRIREQLKAKADLMELKAAERLQKLELNLDDFEESLSYRVNKLDQIPGGMDELEISLRQYIEGSAGKIREDFVRFSNDLEGQREIEKKQASQLFSDFRSSMSDIETSIEKIKSDAYQNVSEKLTLLEDDFFSDLNERSELMSSRMVQWHKGVGQSMEQIASEAKKERVRVESQYHSDLAARLSRVEADSEKGLQGLNSRISLFQDQLVNKLSQAETEMGDVSSRYQKQLVNIEQKAAGVFEEKLVANRDEFAIQIDLYQKTFNEKAGNLQSIVAGSKQELDSMMDQSRVGINQWQTKVMTALKEKSAVISSDIAQLRAQSTDTINSIQNNFTDQKQRMEKEHKEYLSQFDKNVDQLSTRIDKLSTGFEHRGDLLEKQLVSNDSTMKQSVKEARAELLELQQGMENRMDEALLVFNNETTSIDKEIKSFVSQTRLFERADSLKIKLKQEIELMKGELNHLNLEKKELKETDKKFEKMKKMESDLSAKLNSMISQKRKIEEMDNDFKHLLEVSINVDSRLDRVNERSDQLQRVEARMRHLDELETEVDQKYARLDKKRDILDTTTRGVDVNFQQLSQIEERMKGMEGEFTEFLEQLKKSNERIMILSNNKHDADQAVKKLSLLDTELTTMEQRMESMQKARQWLADTETRLKKLNESSEDQMKVLGSIMKNAGREVKGAPVMDSRELVVRLARQGWTTEEIAKSTGLSKGEVDLILEIAPRKRK